MPRTGDIDLSAWPQKMSCTNAKRLPRLAIGGRVHGQVLLVALRVRVERLQQPPPTAQAAVALGLARRRRQQLVARRHGADYDFLEFRSW